MTATVFALIVFDISNRKTFEKLEDNYITVLIITACMKIKSSLLSETKVTNRLGKLQKKKGEH